MLKEPTLTTVLAALESVLDRCADLPDDYEAVAYTGVTVAEIKAAYKELALNDEEVNKND